MVPRLSVREQLSRLLPRLTNATLERLVADVPWYRHLPREIVTDDVRDVLAANLRAFVGLLRSPRTPGAEDIDVMLRAAARRAEERFPLPVLLEGYYAGTRACWARLAELVDSEDAREVVEIGTTVLEYLQLVTSHITEAYVDSALRLRGVQWEARSELCAALVDGSVGPESWERAGLPAWSERTVVVVRTPDAGDDPVSGAMQARRRARLLRDHLHGARDGAVLEAVEPGTAVLLLAGSRERPVLERVLIEVFGEAGWAAAWATAADDRRTAASVRAALETADTALHLGRLGRIHALSELRLEVQLTRPGPARDDLVRLLEPLRGHPDLWSTLVQHLRGGPRREVAQRLHVHPNTLDYRLGRIRDLLGIDPTVRGDALMLRAAMLAAVYVGAAPPYDDGGAVSAEAAG